MTLVENTLEQEIDAWLLADVEAAEAEIHLATDSRSLPDLPNKKDKTNWVEKAGGLPKYIERIAKHLRSEKGMDTSHAIATAVNTVKRWCSSGEVAEGKEGGVSAKTKALACKAVAQWEAKKGKSKADLSQQKERLVVHGGVFVTESDRDLLLSLERIEPLDVDWGEFDTGSYGLALSQARVGRLHMAITFDPSDHPRDLKGRFKSVIGGLARHGSVQLPDGTTVRRTEEGFQVKNPDLDKLENVADAEGAVNKAFAYSGASANPKSLGGKKSFPSADRAIKAHEGLPTPTPEAPENEIWGGLDPEPIASLTKEQAAEELDALRDAELEGRKLTLREQDRIKKIKAHEFGSDGDDAEYQRLIKRRAELTKTPFDRSKPNKELGDVNQRIVQIEQARTKGKAGDGEGGEAKSLSDLPNLGAGTVLGETDKTRAVVGDGSRSVPEKPVVIDLQYKDGRGKWQRSGSITQGGDGKWRVGGGGAGVAYNDADEAKVKDILKRDYGVELK